MSKISDTHLLGSPPLDWPLMPAESKAMAKTFARMARLAGLTLNLSFAGRRRLVQRDYHRLASAKS